MADDRRFDLLTRRHLDDVASHAHEVYKKGWLPATSGNFSIRLPQSQTGAFAITATGLHKGELGGGLADRQWSRRTVDGTALCAGEPESSTDTAIHAALYRAVPQVGAVYHAHLLEATAVARLANHSPAESTPTDPASIDIRWCDTIKAFADWCDWQRGASIECLIAPNADADATAAWVSNAADAGQLADAAPGLNVADHGIYVWGRSPAETRRHLEAFAYLYELELAGDDPS